MNDVLLLVNDAQAILRKSHCVARVDIRVDGSSVSVNLARLSEFCIDVVEGVGIRIFSKIDECGRIPDFPEQCVGKDGL